MPNPFGSWYPTALNPQTHRFGVTFDDAGKLRCGDKRPHTLAISQWKNKVNGGNGGIGGSHWKVFLKHKTQGTGETACKYHYRAILEQSNLRQIASHTLDTYCSTVIYMSSYDSY
jgi:hypothetical protein